MTTVRRAGAAVVAVLALLAAACSGGSGSGSGTAAEGSTASEGLTYVGKAPAPDFPAGLEWFNTGGKPLSIQGDLHGKIVVLDFWTSGCINCIHILPDLDRFEQEFGDDVAVIGVHSAKFTNESTAASIRENIVKDGITHPVVNDANLAVWDAYGAQAWPTTVVIDPLGRVVGGHEGEGVYDAISPVLKTMVAEYGRAGDLDPRPLATVLEAASAAPTVLSYPGAVLADPAGGRLFIADSGHHRILQASLSGELQRQIGSGGQGLVDGPAESAEFANPQGLALSADGATLYVADTANHAIRAVTLATGVVDTIAGSGQQAQAEPSGRPGKDTALSSPWGLALAPDGSRLFIAMAGLHQIWVDDLAKNSVTVFAGSGSEGIDDGAPTSATLAQTSGLALSPDGTTLYFTDPESSSVRQVPTDGSGKVATIVGTGLFDFGDVDGDASTARLQHPLAVAPTPDGRLLVTDTYNDKLKLVDPIARTATTFAGTGQPGLADGVGTAAQLAEPGGLSAVGNTVYVADTANHVIRTVDLQTGAVATLVLSNLGVADSGASAAAVAPEALPAQTVAPGDGSFTIAFQPPSGYVINALGPFSLAVTADDPAVAAPVGAGTVEQAGPTFPVAIPLHLAAGATTVHATGVVYYCRDGNQGLCLARDYAYTVPVTVADGAPATTVAVTHDLPALA